MSRLFCLFAFIFVFTTVNAQQKHLSEQKEEGAVLRQMVQVVTLTASVVDKHNAPIIGLNRDNFEIYEDKVKQKIEYFSDVDIPISIGIIFDASASMETKISRAREALKSFIQSSHPEDDFFLVTFNRQAKLMADYTDGDSILNKMAMIKPEGDTALFDAVFLGLEKLKEARHKKRVLIVISDGQDNCSRYNFRELTKNIKENDAIIYTFSIAEIQGGNCGNLCQMYSRRTMEDLADVTGGKAFFPLTLDDLENATSLIARELRQQYSIGYVSTNSERDGKWRKISVRVLANQNTNVQFPKPIVRSKEGYFAIP